MAFRVLILPTNSRRMVAALNNLLYYVGVLLVVRVGALLVTTFLASITKLEWSLPVRKRTLDFTICRLLSCNVHEVCALR